MANQNVRLNATLQELIRVIEKMSRPGSPANVRTTAFGHVVSSRGSASMLNQRLQRSGSGSLIGRARAGLGRTGAFGALGRLGVVGLGLQAAQLAQRVQAGVNGSISSGLVNQQRGGSFIGGVQQGAVNALSGASFMGFNVGELSGANAIQRTQQDQLQSLNQVTNRIARYGGANAIDDDQRRFLARRFRAQAVNVENDRKKNQALVADGTEGTANAVAGGSFTAEMLNVLKSIESKIPSF